MELATSFISLLGAYLEGSNLREKNKYRDRLIYLEKQYLKEISKNENDIDTNYLDTILIELQLIASSAIAATK